jgi:hypothetical protein
MARCWGAVGVLLTTVATCLVGCGSASTPTSTGTSDTPGGNASATPLTSPSGTSLKFSGGIEGTMTNPQQDPSCNLSFVGDVGSANYRLAVSFSESGGTAAGTHPFHAANGFDAHLKSVVGGLEWTASTGSVTVGHAAAGGNAGALDITLIAVGSTPGPEVHVTGRWFCGSG